MKSTLEELVGGGGAGETGSDWGYGKEEEDVR